MNEEKNRPDENAGQPEKPKKNKYERYLELKKILEEIDDDILDELDDIAASVMEEDDD